MAIEEGTDCHCCGEAPAVVLCLTCETPLCGTCVRLEDYGFGCDGGKVVAFCPDCYADPAMNTVLKYDG
ncbi:MAG: hypothetical protein V1748_05745 [Actinomycetota bacterium]